MQGRLELGIRTLGWAFLQHARVIHALMLRDIKTRFGATYFGFAVGLLIPLAHIGIILSIYIFMGRRAPLGTDVAAYLSTAIVPFVVWSYAHQKVMQAFGQNRALTAFPVVKFIDIFIARAFVEILNSILIVTIVMIVLPMMGVDTFIFQSKTVLCAVMLGFMLGVSTGAVFGVFSILIPSVLIVGILFIPTYWVTSGVFFIPEALPEVVRNIVRLFPLSHIVDILRMGFYPSYVSDYPSSLYIIGSIIANVILALSIDRFLRPALSGH